MLAAAALLSLLATDARVEKARTLFAEGDWAQAAREYEAALKESKDQTLLYPLGHAHHMAGDFVRAIRAYTDYLSEFPNADNAAEVNHTVVELTPLTLKGAKPPKTDKLPPRVRHEVRQSWPAGEAVSIEADIEDAGGVFEPTLYYRLAGKKAFVPTPMEPVSGARYAGLVAPLEPGVLEYFIEAFDDKGNGPTRNGTPSYPHRLRILQPGRPPAEEGEPAAVALPSALGGEPPPVVRAPEVVATGAPGTPPARIAAYAALGAGAVAGVVGVFLGMRTISIAEESAASPLVSSRSDARTRADGAATLTNIAWGAAVVLGGTGGALFFYSRF